MLAEDGLFFADLIPLRAGDFALVFVVKVRSIAGYRTLFHTLVALPGALEAELATSVDTPLPGSLEVGVGVGDVFG